MCYHYNITSLSSSNIILQEANCTELLSHSVSMNPRASRGVAAFFRDAHKANAVVVLDGADVLLSNSSSE